jgi:hypothetical protein
MGVGAPWGGGATQPPRHRAATRKWAESVRWRMARTPSRERRGVVEGHATCPQARGCATAAARGDGLESNLGTVVPADSRGDTWAGGGPDS